MCTILLTVVDRSVSCHSNELHKVAISCTTHDQGTPCTVGKVLAVSLGLILLINTYEVTANTGLAAFSCFIIPLARCCNQHSTNPTCVQLITCIGQGPAHSSTSNPIRASFYFFINYFKCGTESLGMRQGYFMVCKACTPPLIKRVPLLTNSEG